MARAAFEAALRALDDNGDPVSGAKLYWYLAGTTTASPTYSDVDMTVAQAHPIISDANGYFPAIYTADGVYRAVITDSADVGLSDTDNIIQQPTPATASNVTVVPLRDGEPTNVQGYIDEARKKLWPRAEQPAIPDVAMAVKTTHIERLPKQTLLGNPNNEPGPAVSAGNTAILSMLGFLVERDVTEEISLSIPTTTDTIIVKMGRKEFVSTATTGDVEFAKPFPNARFSRPLVIPHAGSALVVVNVGDTPSGGGDETDGFSLTFGEGTSHVALTADRFFTWIALGY